MTDEAARWVGLHDIPGSKAVTAGFNVLPEPDLVAKLCLMLFPNRKFAPDPDQFPLLLFSTIPSRDSWPASGEPLGEHRLAMFYLRILRQYDLAILVTDCREVSIADPDPDHRWNRQRLARYLGRRIAGTAQPNRAREAVAAALESLRNDVRAVLDLLAATLTPAHAEELGIAVGSTSREEQTVMEALRCIYLVGKLPRPELIAHTRKVFSKPNQLARRLVENGAYGPQDVLNRLVGPSPDEPEEALPKLALDNHARFRTYHLMRDFARWLSSGAQAWAKTRPLDEKSFAKFDATQGSPKRNWKILLIDPQLKTLDSERFERDSNELYDDPRRTGSRLRYRLDLILARLFPAGSVDIDLIDDEYGILPSPKDAVGDSVVALDRFLAGPLQGRVHHGDLSPHARAETAKDRGLGIADYQWSNPNVSSDPTWSLWDYDVIFCEVDYESHFAGPQIVQKLGSFFERTTNPAKTLYFNHEAERKGYTLDPRHMERRQMIALEGAPAMIVLTRSSNFAYTHQCLNLGAHYYVAKDRLFQIPTRMRDAVADEDRRALHRSDSRKAGLERTGHRSNFRNLYALRPDRKASLQRADERSVVVGDETDRAFVQRLPKADLHCHIGTTIRLETIQALAFNTFRHMIKTYSSFQDARQQVPPGERPPANDGEIALALGQALEAVMTTGIIRAWCKVRKNCEMATALERLHPAELLYVATKLVVSRDPSRHRDSRAPTFRSLLSTLATTNVAPLDVVVSDLAPLTSAVRVHQAAALVVVVTSLLTAGRSSQKPDQLCGRIKESWGYIGNVAAWRDALNEDSGTGAALSSKSLNERALWTEMFIDPAAKSCHEQTQNTKAGDGIYLGGSYFRHLYESIADGVSSSIVTLGAEADDAWLRLERAFHSDGILHELVVAEGRGDVEKYESQGLLRMAREHVPTLETLVSPRSGGEEFPREAGKPLGGVSLLRYLWGCGLLGADHLQYPENLLLAAHDIVRQQVDECIIYSEVRCETPGFTRAGMTPLGATDVLRAGFDLASAFLHCTNGELTPYNQDEWRGKGKLETRRKPFVRVNILLAAKRHKTLADCAAVVSLLETCLSGAPRHLDCDDLTIIPAWWKPCAVVGFDLSGNEAVQEKDIEVEIRRLFKYHSPITIHAGEAATADRVWQAVYTLHARRIGHGLRLRENPRLLQYCIDEGICMEMCPISNVLTHGFADVEKSEAYDGDKIEHYPLRHYMAAGLEVCINTDNRALHCGKTLTDEYLMAARLSGGFSRWEILKLARAGFKHAFLPKVEVADLLSAVENRVYAQTAHREGMDWWSTL